MQVEICKFVGFEVKIPTRLQLKSSRRSGRIRPPQVLKLSLVLDWRLPRLLTHPAMLAPVRLGLGVLSVIAMFEQLPR